MRLVVVSQRARSYSLGAILGSIFNSALSTPTRSPSLWHEEASKTRRCTLSSSVQIFTPDIDRIIQHENCSDLREAGSKSLEFERCDEHVSEASGTNKIQNQVLSPMLISDAVQRNVALEKIDQIPRDVHRIQFSEKLVHRRIGACR